MGPAGDSDGTAAPYDALHVTRRQVRDGLEVPPLAYTSGSQAISRFSTSDWLTIPIAALEVAAMAVE